MGIEGRKGGRGKGGKHRGMLGGIRLQFFCDFVYRATPGTPASTYTNKPGAAIKHFQTCLYTGVTQCCIHNASATNVCYDCFACNKPTVKQVTHHLIMEFVYCVSFIGIINALYRGQSDESYYLAL